MRKTGPITKLNPLIIALYPHQKKHAQNIAKLFENATILEPETKNLKEKIQNAFSENTPIIGFCATAILIRILAPLIKDKAHDPPVIAISENDHIIPLLGGHKGANQLAQYIAEKEKKIPVITNISECHFNIALDDPPLGWEMENPQKIKEIIKNILNGKKIRLHSDTDTPYPINADWVEKSNLPFEIREKNSRPAIICTDARQYGKGERMLTYIPKRLIIGVGCVRGCPPEIMQKLIENTLIKYNLSSKAVALIVSIDIKEDEEAMHKLAQYYQIPIRFFTAQELARQKPHIQNPSSIVERETGTPSVAEAAALHAAYQINIQTEQKYRLFVQKQKNTHATCAITIMENAIKNSNIGKKRGTLSIVGLGPGAQKWRSRDAQNSLMQAQHWVGYHGYLELAGQPPKNTQIHSFQLGEEEKRIIYALNLAAKGYHVALICSGDPGIYAMASPLFDKIQKPPPELSDGAKRVHIHVSPGISAMHAAAAKIGAPLGQDFCAISLSDLLTPKKTILKRLRAAAKGDFVIALYNPQSKTRTEILPRVHNILLQYRSPQTPVAIAENVEREKENIHITTLGHMKCETVTMNAIILIGSSQTQTLKTPNAKHIMWTPRGYHNKKIKGKTPK